MKVYVDEMPKDCWDCPMHDGENGWCKMLVCYTDYIPKDCPLQSLADHDKQVRAEVVKEIKLKAVHSHFGYMGKTKKGYYDIYAGILEDIEQGGE